jgi:predicted AAA+ superfamily ATPase
MVRRYGNMVNRIVNPLTTNSFFLFGARGTGKSTFIREHFSSSSIYFDLLDPALEDRLSRNPNDLHLLLGNESYEWVIIDEVQKTPRLLDIVHSLIESRKQKFILTGSSARKLKRGGANLLAGRAFVYDLFPFVTHELGDDYNLPSLLQFGSLPKVVTTESLAERKAYLRSYALTYIKEEVSAEQILRKLDPFRNFLRIAADQSGKLVNHSAIGKQLGIDHKTVVNYFSILEDTLLGFYLPSFHLSVRKSQIVAPKFFFFDLGVRNSLSEMIDLTPSPQSSYFGDLFEHFVILEAYRLNSYLQRDYRFSHLRTKSGFEVDLILSKGRANILVEIKSTIRIDPNEVAHLARNTADISQITERFYVSLDAAEVELHGVRCMSWNRFLKVVFLSDCGIVMR